MSAWLIVEFMLPPHYRSMVEFHRDLIFATPEGEDRRRVEHAKYFYHQNLEDPIRMVVPECAGLLDALRALNCSLISQERIEGPEGEDR